MKIIYKCITDCSDEQKVITTMILKQISMKEFKQHAMEIKSGICGLIIGDALGVPVEFEPKKKFR